MNHNVSYRSHGESCRGQDGSSWSHGGSYQIKMIA